MDTANVHRFVGNSLAALRQADMMLLPHPNMPLEMRDDSRQAEDDWQPWEAIASTVTDDDIHALELVIQRKLPDLYVRFLKYKHFYELAPMKDINFFRHGIREWKEELIAYYTRYWNPAELVGQGYIPFAHYFDHGIVCFNTNKPSGVDNDYQVVVFDHDDLSNGPHELYASFAEMMRDLVAAQEAAK